ncbi:hypothetical protein ACWDPI_32960, partial [Streptomyces zhihengii]
MTATDFTALREALADVVAIPVTPFTAEDTIDEPAHRALIRRLVDGGVRTLTPNGNSRAGCPLVVQGSHSPPTRTACSGAAG